MFSNNLIISIMKICITTINNKKTNEKTNINSRKYR